jgi:glycosyltransferase involved in cell wall biosynthesis
MAALTPWPTVPKSTTQPFVSIITPTYNRRHFIPRLISYIMSQTYPRERMEWVVLDDGTDSVEDLIAPYMSKIAIQYIRVADKLNIGAKRNRLHKAARGDVLVTMDDDDYYPPERVAHAITSLRAHRGAQLAGSSRNHLYFTDDGSIWSVGPYAPNHATFGTMAYTKEYAMKHPCDETKLHAEELEFTNRYSEPLVQLNPRKVMLVLCHRENTFSKNDLRVPDSPVIRKTSLKLRDFIAKAEDRAFYTRLSAAQMPAPQ